MSVHTDNTPCVFADNFINRGLGLSDEDCNMNFATSDKDKNEISKYCMFIHECAEVGFNSWSSRRLIKLSFIISFDVAVTALDMLQPEIPYITKFLIVSFDKRWWWCPQASVF